MVAVGLSLGAGLGAGISQLSVCVLAGAVGVAEGVDLESSQGSGSVHRFLARLGRASGWMRAGVRKDMCYAPLARAAESSTVSLSQLNVRFRATRQAAQRNVGKDQ